MILEKFKVYLQNFVPRKSTQRTYYYSVSGLINDNPEIGDVDYIKSLNDKELLDILNSYIVSKKRSYHIQYALKLFLEFINRGSIYRKLAKINLQARKQASKNLSFTEIKKLVDSTNELDLKLIIMLQYDSASRVGAILGLTNKSISRDEEGETKVIMKEKRGRIKTAYLSEQTVHVLEQYIKEKGVDMSISSKTKKLFEYDRKDQYHLIWERITKLSMKALGFKISSHWFRHSRAISLFERGYDIFTISRLLGHASLDSTKSYLEAAGIESKKLMKKESPNW